MELPSSRSLASLPGAFATACRLARTDVELYERCREVLVEQFNSDRIWLSATNPASSIAQTGPAKGGDAAVEVARLSSGSTEVVITAGEEIAGDLRRVALPVALGLSVMLELRSVLAERQAQLDDAVFQLRALRQVARLLSSVHSTEDTEQLILDFMAEVFFAWWGCLYRPAGDRYEAKVFRSLQSAERPQAIERQRLDLLLPLGSAVSDATHAALSNLLPAGARLIVPLDSGVERIAVLLLGSRISDRPYGRAELELAATLSFAAAIALKNAELVEQLHSAAMTDGLTGLHNRRALEQRLEAEISRGNRHRVRTSIILADVDHFKVINDTLGHAAGDRLLVLIAEILRRQCRTLDVVGRLAGDEFLILLPMTTPEEAMVFVTRVQGAMAELARTHREFGNVTLSIGIAELPRHGTTNDSLVAAADAALYRAKRNGRNAVAVAE